MFLHPTTLHSKIILNVGNYGFFVLTDRYYRGQLFQTFCHPTFSVLPSLLQVLLDAEVVVAWVVEVASVEVAVEVSEPEVASVEVAEPEVVSVEVAVAVPFSIPSELQVFAHIHSVFLVSIPVSFVV